MTDLKGNVLSQLMVLLTMVSIFMACENTESVPDCNYADPLKELSWLREYAAESADCSCQISLMQGVYSSPGKQETVFFKLVNDPLCDVVFGTVLFSCEGETIKAYGVNDMEQFNSEVTIDKTLHVCKES